MITQEFYLKKNEKGYRIFRRKENLDELHNSKNDLKLVLIVLTKIYSALISFKA